MGGRYRGIPVVSAWHNNLDQDGWLRNALDFATCGLAQTHIAVSQGVLESAKRIMGAPRLEGNTFVITNGINIQRIHAASGASSISRYDLGIKADQFVIGSVGRFEPVKRYDLMLEAFALLHARYPQTRLVLVGSGNLEEQLRLHAHELGIKHAVIFVVGQSAYSYYPLFDCFSLSSDKEGISIALLEAMSFGLPCAITHQGTDHAVIHDGLNGLLVEAGNAQMLAQTWALLMAKPKLAVRMGNLPMLRWNRNLVAPACAKNMG